MKHCILLQCFSDILISNQLNDDLVIIHIHMGMFCVLLNFFTVWPKCIYAEVQLNSAGYRADLNEVLIL